MVISLDEIFSKIASSSDELREHLKTIPDEPVGCTCACNCANDYVFDLNQDEVCAC